MDARTQELMKFLDSAHSVYHAVGELVDMLKTAGYTHLPESAQWELAPGGKYYMTRGGSALVAFRMPEETPQGFMISASHADRPTFKIKENCGLTGQYTKLAVEPYGGMLMHTWLDRPLSLAGRVVVETDNGVESRLLDLDRDLLLIPNVAAHLKNTNKEYQWNPATDMLPLLGCGDAAQKLEAQLEEAAGGKILGHDLYLYVRQKAVVWGIEEEFLSAPALDDLSCVWSCARGFLNSRESGVVPVLCVFDSEEVGSASLQGAGSDLLERVLTRICQNGGWDMARMLAQSFLVSADNGHGLHPNHPEYSDATNAPALNGGVVLKYQASQRYTTDGTSGAIFRTICKRANIPVQTYCNRADLRGGATLGNVSIAHVAVLSVDIGMPQLAMHSAFETAGVKDALWLEEAMTGFYNTALKVPADGSYIL